MVLFFSSSSHSNTSYRKHDVFISFRGEDTREGFVSHLHAALSQKNIQTFIDNQLTRGDEISPSLSNAIRESNISIIVFSERYASSSWCLQELVNILECKKTFGQIVIPVFYHVHPSSVRNQTGTFADAFVEHRKYEDRLHKLQTWRIALFEAANLSGFDSAAIRPESVLVKEIVKDVLKRLNISQSDYMDLIGMDLRFKKIESLLCIGSKHDCVRSVGIWGIGGIGKTSLADAVFSKICSQFEASYFIQSVREISEESRGLIRMKQELLSVILQDKNLNMGSHRVGTTFTRNRLRCKKVLIVFDDVTDSIEIESLVGGLDFGSGSRFIITTRDKRVLRNCRVNKIFKADGLLKDEALQLFSQYAFKQNYPEADYINVSQKVVAYAKGVPLALKVLGSFLFGTSKNDWESALKKLERIPHQDIQKVLKISYDGLDDEVKNIFLDIACFFKWKDKDHVVNILDACGFFTEIGLSILIDKSLIIMEGNVITMHDLLQDMGREIIRQESRDIGEHSRLWHPEDIYHVLTTNTGTKAIEAIYLDTNVIREMHLTPHAFAKMHNLRLLKLYHPWHQEEHQVHVLQYLEFSSTKLVYFHWIGCPSKMLGSSFHPEYLVELYMPHSKMEQLWNGVKHLVKLKHIDLSDSKHLTICPDISLAINLERLILKGCTSLVDIPSFIPAKSLTTLDLSGCLNLKSFQETSIFVEHPVKLKHMDLSDLKHLTRCPDLSLATNLETLILRGCINLIDISSSIPVKSLTKLDLYGCSNLKKFPDMSFIMENAFLDETAVSSSSIRLPQELRHSNALNFFEVRSIAMREVPLPIRHCLCSLMKLDLTDCGIMELPSSLGWLYSLKKLYLARNNFVSLPESIVDLDKLEYIGLSYCERLQSIPKLPRNLMKLEAKRCTSLEGLFGLPFIFSTISSSRLINWTFNFFDCLKLDGKAFGDIVKDLVLKIQLMGTAWFEEFYNKFVPRARIYAPGREIPEWFNFQSTSKFIDFKLPLNGDRNFVCAVCIAVIFQDLNSQKIRGSILCKINGKSVYISIVNLESDETDHGIYDFFLLGHRDFHDSYSDNDDGSIYHDYHDNGNDDCGSNNRDCHYSDSRSYDGSNKVSFIFDIRGMKKCGVHLVYDQDFEEPMKKLNGSFKFQSSWRGRSSEDRLIGNVLADTGRWP